MSRRPTTASSPHKSPKKVKSNISPNVTTAEYENMLNDQQHMMSMQVSEKEIEIDRLKTTVFTLNTKCTIVDEHLKNVQNARGDFKESEDERYKLQQHMLQTADTVKQDAASHNQYQQQLTDQINELQNKLKNEEQRQYQKELTWRKEREDMQTKHHNDIQKVNDEKENVRANMQHQLNQVRNEMEQVRIDLTNQKEQVRINLTNEKEQVRRDLTDQKEQLRIEKDTKYNLLEDEFQRYKESSTITINNQNIQIQELTITIRSHESTIISLKEIIEQKKDVEAQLATCRNDNAKFDQQNQALQKELDIAADYILELEEKVYRANKTSLELLKQLKEAEVEIDTLKQYIIDLKQRIAVYIPVKEDPVDKKLAEFINNYPERSKLKIMFMRESEGVYQFGTKRVAVKVEKDNIKIRFGGGYLSLDEFLDQYTPVELEKLERKDPLKRFSEKIAVQKTIVNAGVRENSPVRSPGRSSPKRKLAV